MLVLQAASTDMACGAGAAASCCSPSQLLLMGGRWWQLQMKPCAAASLLARLPLHLLLLLPCFHLWICSRQAEHQQSCQMRATMLLHG